VFQHEAGLRLGVCVVTCKVVGEELTVFENGVDRLAKKPCLAAETADGLAVPGLEFSDNHSRG
jgi:hypothetical protein